MSENHDKSSSSWLREMALGSGRAADNNPNLPPLGAQPNTEANLAATGQVPGANPRSAPADTELDFHRQGSSFNFLPRDIYSDSQGFESGLVFGYGVSEGLSEFFRKYQPSQKAPVFLANERGLRAYTSIDSASDFALVPLPSLDVVALDGAQFAAEANAAPLASFSLRSRISPGEENEVPDRIIDLGQLTQGSTLPLIFQNGVTHIQIVLGENRFVTAQIIRNQDGSFTVVILPDQEVSEAELAAIARGFDFSYTLPGSEFPQNGMFQPPQLVTTAPPPTVPSGTLSSAVTNGQIVSMHGTVDDFPRAVSVTVVMNGADYQAENHGDGSWSLRLDLSEELSDEVLSEQNIIVRFRDDQANQSETPGRLLMDLVAPQGGVSSLIVDHAVPTVRGWVDDPAAEVHLLIGGTLHEAQNHGDGSWTFADWENSALALGQNSVVVQFVDPVGNTSQVSAFIDFNSVPLAADDSATTLRGLAARINVLANDTDPDGDALFVQSATTSSGRVLINPDGSLVYFADSDFTGADRIEYVVADASGNLSAASVHVTVLNRDPIAMADSASTNNLLRTTEINVLANDRDSEGDALYVESVAGAQNGSVVINLNGTVQYTADVGFSGSDSFSYVLRDSHGGMAVQTVNVSVADVIGPDPEWSNLRFSHDSGTYDNDLTTNVGAQVFTAQLDQALEAGATVHLSLDNGQSWTDVTAGLDGLNFSWTLNLVPGNNNILIKATDTSDNDSDIHVEHYHLDLVAPDVTATVVSLSADTGTSDSDFVTNVSAQQITIDLSRALQTGEFVQGSLDGGETWVIIPDDQVSGSQVLWDTAFVSPDGVLVSSAIQIKVSDMAGNDGAAGSRNYTYEPPGGATSTFASGLSHEGGRFGSVAYTNVADQRVIAPDLGLQLGTGERVLGSIDNGQTFVDITSYVSSTVYTDGREIFSIDWSGVDLSSVTDPARTNLVLQVRTQADNIRAESTLDYTLDQDTPSHEIINLRLSADSGFDSDDLITNVQQQTLIANVINGTLGFNERLFLSIDGGAAIDLSVFVLPDGELRYDLSLESGEHSLAFWVEDLATNRGEVLLENYVYLPPIPPEGVVPIENINIADDSGTFANDFVTNQPLQTVTATLAQALDSYQFLRLSVDGGLTWQPFDESSLTGLSFEGGNVELLPGSNNLMIQVADLAGNIVAQGLQVYVLDTEAPTTTVLNIDFVDDSGTSADDFITNVNPQRVTAQLSAALEADESLFASLNGGVTWQNISAAVSGTDVSWSNVTLPASGLLVMEVRDLAGNAAESSEQTYVFDNVAPDQTIGGVTLSGDFGSDNGDLITNLATQTVTATLSAALRDGEFLEASVDNGTTWQRVPVAENSTAITWENVVLLEGQNNLVFRITDAAGNQGATSSAPYTLDTEAVINIVIDAVTVDNIVNFDESQDEVIVSGTVSGEYQVGMQVQVTVNGQAYLGSIAAGGLFSVAVQGSDLAAATRLEVQVLGEDEAGNSLGQVFAHDYEVDVVAPVIEPDQSFDYTENEIDSTIIATVDAGTDASLVDFNFATGGKTSADGYFVIDQDGNIRLTEAGALATSESNDYENGNNVFSYDIVAVDRAGNQSAPTEITLNLQNSQVTIESIVHGADGTTFSGTASNPGGDLTLTVDGANYTVVASDDDTWTYTLPPTHVWGSGTLIATIEGVDPTGVPRNFPYARIIESESQPLRFEVSYPGNLDLIIVHYQVNGVEENRTMLGSGSFFYLNDPTGADVGDVITYWFTIDPVGLPAAFDTDDTHGIDQYTLGSGGHTLPQASMSFFIDTLNQTLATDTGDNSDGITSDATVNVSLAGGINGWQFSRDGGQTWNTGSGTSFELEADTHYAAGQIQVRQSRLSSGQTIFSAADVNNSAIFVDTTAPELQANQRFSYQQGQVADAVIATLAASDNGDIVAFHFEGGLQVSDDGFFQIDDLGNLSLTVDGAAPGAPTNDFASGDNDFTYSIYALDAAGNSSLLTEITLNVRDQAAGLTDETAANFATFDFMALDTILDEDDLLLPEVADQLAAFADLVVAGDAQDHILGGATSDAIFGAAGDDRLFGGEGRDLLRGGDGDDVLAGGQGADVLRGDAGADTFLFAADDHLALDAFDTSRSDIIKDFSLAEGDVLDLAELLQGEDQDSLENYLNFTREGDDVLVDIDVDGDGSGTDWSIRFEGLGLEAEGLSSQAILANLLLGNNLHTD